MGRMLRRLVVGFAAGAAAGWVGGLFRRPARGRGDTPVDAAERMPQHEFGDPAEASGAGEPARPAPGARTAASEPTPTKPAKPAKAAKAAKAAGPAKATKPAKAAKATKPAKAAKTTTPAKPAKAAGSSARRTGDPPNPTDAATAELRAGHEAAAQQLDDIELPPAPPPPGPAARRRPTKPAPPADGG